MPRSRDGETGPERRTSAKWLMAGACLCTEARLGWGWVEQEAGGAPGALVDAPGPLQTPDQRAWAPGSVPGQPPQWGRCCLGRAGTSFCKDQVWSPKTYVPSRRVAAMGAQEHACPTALTGSLVLQAHIYSLGATLKAALEYVAEPEPRLSQDLELLLRQMQAEDPGDRPDLEVMAGVLQTSAQRLRPKTLPGAAHVHTCTHAYTYLHMHTCVYTCACTRALLSPAHRLFAYGLVVLHFFF